MLVFSSPKVGSGLVAERPGNGTVALPDEVGGLRAGAGGTFDGSGPPVLAPGMPAPGSGTARVVSVSQCGFSGFAAPGRGTPAGIARVDSSSHAWRSGLAADNPGSGTVALPLELIGGAGSGTAWLGDEPGSGTAAVVAPGFTGKMFWQVGHLMRAPPGGIFLSSMVRLEVHDGQATFMELP